MFDVFDWVDDLLFVELCVKYGLIFEDEVLCVIYFVES